MEGGWNADSVVEGGVSEEQQQKLGFLILKSERPPRRIPADVNKLYVDSGWRWSPKQNSR